MPHRPTKDIDLLGFGDAVTPGPIDTNYPVLLNDLPSPKIRTYPIYTVIAEKFHAIALLGMANSRLKDYLDLYILLKNEELDEKILLDAIAATFARREMALPKDTPLGLTSEYSQDASRQAMWRSFLNKNELEFISLQDVVTSISDFVLPIIVTAQSN